MKKLFFYTNAKLYDESAGITKKVKSQVKAFASLGYDVEYTAYGKDGLILLNNEDKIINSKKYLLKNRRIQRYSRRYELIIFAIESINERDVYDVAYLRYHTFDRLFCNLLKKCKEKCNKTVLEMHAYPSLEFKFGKMLPIYIIDKMWEKKAANYIDRFAVMHNCKELFGKPVTIIYNAVDDFNTYLFKNMTYIDKKEISLIAVGYEAPLHGYDLLIKGLESYYDNGGDYNILVNLVGSYQKKTLDLISNSNYSDHFILHGKKNGIELTDLYNSSDIAIGTLALHRRGGMKSTSSLKLIEYLAMGLPCVYSGKELMISDDFPYALKKEDNEKELDITKLIYFYNTLSRNNISKQDIHNSIAIDENTWKYQMGKVLE